MPAIKSGTFIHIIGPGITSYEDILIDIADTAWFEKISTSPLIYQVKGPHVIRVVDEGQLQQGDSNDFSKQETLEIAPTANGNSGFLIDHGGAFFLYGNIEIKHTINSFFGTWTTRGKLFLRGNTTYKPKISNFHRLDFTYNSIDSNDFIHDIWDIEKGLFENAFNTSSQPFGIALNTISPKHRFVDNVYDAKVGALPGEYSGFAATFAADVYDTGRNILIDNCTFKHFNSQGLRLIGSSAIVKNCLFDTNKNQGCQIDTNAHLPKLDHAQITGPYGTFSQEFYVLENCNFINNTTSSITTRGVPVLFKNCNFNETNKNIIASPALVFLWTGNIFAATIVLSKSFGAAFFDVRALDLTITDTNDNPIEGANITITQKNKKETWTFTTDINGKLITSPYLENKIILVWRERIDPLPNTYEFWSDDSNATYHTIEISAFGFVTKQQPIVMDQDRIVTIKLQVGVAPPPVLAKVLELDSRYL